MIKYKIYTTFAFGAWKKINKTEKCQVPVKNFAEREVMNKSFDTGKI